MKTVSNVLNVNSSVLQESHLQNNTAIRYSSDQAWFLSTVIPSPLFHREALSDMFSGLLCFAAFPRLNMFTLPQEYWSVTWNIYLSF